MFFVSTPAASPPEIKFQNIDRNYFLVQKKRIFRCHLPVTLGLAWVPPGPDLDLDIDIDLDLDIEPGIDIRVINRNTER